jgi:hypothetical protein
MTRHQGRYLTSGPSEGVRTRLNVEYSMQQAIDLPDIHRLADCLSEANRRELPRTRDVVCVIVQDQDILQMEPNPSEYCIHCTTKSKLTIVHDWQRALTDTDLRSIRASIPPVMHDVAPMLERTDGMARADLGFLAS